jgi:ethylmalonyl-CoA/methylmalonyl-CoA decarboxylase
MVFAEEHLKGRIRSREAVNRFMYDTLTRMSRLPLITVASLAGAALGGGTELLTTFDYVCMDSTTFIRFVQTKMGVTSPWGGIHRLVDRIGRKHALRIVANAQPIDARMAHQIGLVDKVVDSSNTGELDAYETCLAVCLDLIRPFVFDPKSKERVSPAAVRGMKQLMARSERSTSGVIDHDMALFNSVATLAKL